MNLQIRKYVLIGIIFLPLFYLYTFHHQMVQSQAFYNFADQRSCAGIPHFHNVLSNIFFTIFSSYGLFRYFKSRESYSISWLVFLVGVFLVAPGSAYFHWEPNDARLVWDRLPMTIGFMGLTSVALVEVFNLQRFEKMLVTMLVLFGVYSVYHWVWFNDLRVYAWVQITPIVSLLYISLCIKIESLRPKYLFGAAAMYILAKRSETYDLKIFDSLGYSGHSIKHILAAIAVYILILMKPSKKNS